MLHTNAAVYGRNTETRWLGTEWDVCVCNVLYHSDSGALCRYTPMYAGQSQQ